MPIFKDSGAYLSSCVFPNQLTPYEKARLKLKHLMGCLTVIGVLASVMAGNHSEKFGPLWFNETILY